MVKNEVHSTRFAVSLFFLGPFGAFGFRAGLLFLSTLEGLLVDIVSSDSLHTSFILSVYCVDSTGPIPIFARKEKNNLLSGCSAPYPIPLNVLNLKKFQYPVLTFILGFLHQRYIALRLERGDCVLVHHLLASVAIDDDNVVVESFNCSSDLKTVSQKDGNRNALFAHLIQECILDVNGLVHLPYPQ